MRRLQFPLSAFIALVFLCLSAKRSTAQDIQNLPSVFQNNLILVYAKIPDNDTLWFYTDTGGMNFIYKSGLKKLSASPKGKNLWKKLNLDPIFDRNNIPVSGARTIQYLKERTENTDGMLGREWFSGGRWLLDYKNQQFGTFKSVTDPTQENSNQHIPLYFRKVASEKTPKTLPRIEVVIDDDTLSFLLDTGAQAYLSENGQKKLHSDPVIATSFIIESVYKKWHNEHPTWEVIENATQSRGTNARMIQVPKVRIGSREVGPVYFTVREDSNFQRLSDLYMDQPVQGALGGNYLSLLGQIVIDYNSEYLKIPD